MAEFERIFSGIERLWVPFDIDKTSVFALDAGEGGGMILADCATTEYDVKNVILPALKSCGKKPAQIFISHNHGDHSGGLPFIMEAFPNAELVTGCRKLADFCPERSRVLTDGERISPRWTAVALPGHTEDSMGLLDSETGTLLSFDGLQIFGVAKWGMGVGNVSLYRKTLLRGAETETVRNLLTSHEYFDLGCMAQGRNAVLGYFTRCREALEQVERFVRESGITDAALLAEKYRREVSALPIGKWTFEAILKEQK